MSEDTISNLELKMLNTLPDDKLKKYLHKAPKEFRKFVAENIEKCPRCANYLKNDRSKEVVYALASNSHLGDVCDESCIKDIMHREWKDYQPIFTILSKQKVDELCSPECVEELVYHGESEYGVCEVAILDYLVYNTDTDLTKVCSPECIDFIVHYKWRGEGRRDRWSPNSYTETVYHGIDLCDYVKCNGDTIRESLLRHYSGDDLEKICTPECIEETFAKSKNPYIRELLAEHPDLKDMCSEQCIWDLAHDEEEGVRKEIVWRDDLGMICSPECIWDLAHDKSGWVKQHFAFKEDLAEVCNTPCITDLVLNSPPHVSKYMLKRDDLGEICTPECMLALGKKAKTSKIIAETLKSRDDFYEICPPTCVNAVEKTLSPKKKEVKYAKITSY